MFAVMAISESVRGGKFNEDGFFGFGNIRELRSNGSAWPPFKLLDCSCIRSATVEYATNHTEIEHRGERCVSRNRPARRRMLRKSRVGRSPSGKASS